VNLKKGNLPATLLEAMTIKNVFSSPSIRNAGIQLEAFEVGNEADLYSMNGERPPTYTVGQYVSECVLILILRSRYRLGKFFYPHAAAFPDGIRLLA
jgi:hypothetical protein